MSITGTKDCAEVESEFELHLASQLEEKVREISKLIIRKGKWKAIRQLKSAAVFGPSVLKKIEKKSIQRNYSIEVTEMLLQKRCGCSDLVDKIRKEVLLTSLHDHWENKYHVTANGFSVDPIKFFEVTYQDMFLQFKLPTQIGIKKIDPNLYTYYYDAISKSRHSVQL